MTNGWLPVERQDSDIFLRGKMNERVWRQLAREFSALWADGHRECSVHAAIERPHTPAFDVPLAALIEGWRRAGMEITVDAPASAAELGQFAGLFPLALVADERPAGDQYFSKVWEFDGETAAELSNTLAIQALEMTAWAEGTWDFFCIILWELLDNVLEHSQIARGFVEVQVVSGTIVRLTVADAGIGVLRSFQRSSRQQKPRTDTDALTLAIREGSSSLDEKGRGNGLWLASRIAASGTGDFSLESGRGLVYWHAGQRNAGFRPINRERPFLSSPLTVAVLEFDASRSAKTIEVLGYQPVVPERERLLSEEGQLSVSIANSARGTATRRSAEQLRNYIQSIYNQSPTLIELDFAGVAVISMSFADELVGALASQLGVSRYARTVRVANATPLIQQLVDRAVDLRFRP